MHQTRSWVVLYSILREMLRAGPAGTGKTESTKDLGSALAKVVYVFNCSPEMDYKGLGNIFKGLGSSGAWGCFDEFNRLIPEVLSVCTVQFKAVCDAIKAGASRVVVEGDEVSLDSTCGADSASVSVVF